jgi:hypothetical protein
MRLIFDNKVTIMKKYINMLILLVFFLTLSCSDSETRFGSLLGSRTTVIINLGLPAPQVSATRSVLDRVLRFFASDAVAQSAPAALSSIQVRVTGPDIGAIEQQFAPFGQVSLNVPSGSFRQFEVLANVDSGDPGAALSYRGTAIANLPAGETVSVPVVMSLNETKILVPDYLNSRIVVMNNPGVGWNTVNSYTYLQASHTLYPYDIDYDSRGRIYVANYAAAPEGDILRFDDTTFADSGTLRLHGSIGLSWLTSVAVDRSNNRVFYSNGTQLFQSDLDGGSEKTLPLTDPNSILPAIGQINGMDAGPGGNRLYIAGTDVNYLSTIFIYDPDVSRGRGIHGGIAGAFTSANLVTPMDVQVRPPYVYVANLNGNFGDFIRDGYNIFQLQIDSANALSPAAHYGNSTGGSPTPPFGFHGPRHFVGLRNEYLIVIDEGFGPSDRLVSFGNILGTGWVSYPATGSSSGSGVGQYNFYSFC